MKIVETRVLYSAGVMKLIITEWMDTLAFLMNAKVYKLIDKSKLISICCIKDFGKIIELGVVITTKNYRGKGYMAKLLKHVLKEYGPLYLICLKCLESYYKKFGFKTIKKAPWPLRIRAGPYNFFAGLLGWEPIVYMKRK
jgi:N-acetylglutamate synthase-like GNAT family acetyltransferase